MIRPRPGDALPAPDPGADQLDAALVEALVEATVGRAAVLRRR